MPLASPSVSRASGTTLRLARTLSVTLLTLSAGACAASVSAEGGAPTEAQLAPQAEVARDPGVLVQEASAQLRAEAALEVPAPGLRVETGSPRELRGVELQVSDPEGQGACARHVPATLEYNTCCEAHAWSANAGCDASHGFVGC